MIKYLGLKQVHFIHQQMIKKYGGTLGVRDEGLLESAMVRPRMSVCGQDAYPSLFQKAAAVFHSIIKNHPFIDGNKRTAFASMHMTLLINDYDLKCSNLQAEDMTIQAAIGKIDEKDIAQWIAKHSKKRH